MLALLMIVACVKVGSTPPVEAKHVSELQQLPSRIAFGSCAKQTKDQPILDTIVGAKPDLMIYLGDNIYADTERPMRMRRRYWRLAGKPEFQRLRAAVPTVATWDDHDYGRNNAGSELESKGESKAQFLDFWGVRPEAPERSRPGIYTHHIFESNGRRLQLIMLDTRWFRDSLTELPPKRARAYDSPFKNEYRPDDNPDLSLLGAGQWAWLEARLREPADMRVIASSIQFGHSYNGYESWNNMPRERTRMQQLIADSGANGVVFLSGDVHWGEISELESDITGYPLYDITSSGLTQLWRSTEYNDNRLGSVVTEEHFGLLEIDWSASDPRIDMRLMGLSGQVLVEAHTTLGVLSGVQSPKN
jgi:alkaline phosphatase D